MLNIESDIFWGDEETPKLGFYLAKPPADILVLGSGDWAGLDMANGDKDVRVRLYSGGGRIVVTGVAVMTPNADDDWPLAVTELRDVPLKRLQALLEHPVWSQAISQAMSYARDLSVDLAPGAGYHPTDVDFLVEGPVRAPATEYEIGGVDLDLPIRPPEFYVEVAAAWTSALANGHKNPAAVLAKANKVETTRVHRWVRVARERGILPPSTRTPKSGRSKPDQPPPGDQAG